jgi:hypothetical protein
VLLIHAYVLIIRHRNLTAYYTCELSILLGILPGATMVIVKVKVKLSLCVTKYHAMKTMGGGGIAPRINLGI